MEVANKLVTLADLKAAYDDLKATCEDLRRKANMWEDITDQLTFSAATWQPLNRGDNVYDIVWRKTTAGVRGASASIRVAPGERYRLTAWSAGDELQGNNGTLWYTAALLNASDGLITACCPNPSNRELKGTYSTYFCWRFAPVEFTIPKNARTLVVFSFGAVRGMGSSVDDVILEKLVQ